MKRVWPVGEPALRFQFGNRFVQAPQVAPHRPPWSPRLTVNVGADRSFEIAPAHRVGPVDAQTSTSARRAERGASCASDERARAVPFPRPARCPPRSSRMQSAPRVCALSTYFSTFTGTYRSERTDPGSRERPHHGAARAVAGRRCRLPGKQAQRPRQRARPTAAPRPPRPKTSRGASPATLSRGPAGVCLSRVETRSHGERFLFPRGKRGGPDWIEIARYAVTNAERALRPTGRRAGRHHRGVHRR